MSLKQREYDGIPYVLNTGPRARQGPTSQEGRDPDLGRVALLVTPSNILQASARAQELSNAIGFDSLRLACEASTAFTNARAFEALAPFVKELIVHERCEGLDFGIFEPLKELRSFSSMAKHPRGLRLAAYPALWHCTLGALDDESCLVGAPSLEELRLFGDFPWSSQGWGWLSELPALRSLTLANQKLPSLIGVPSCPELKMLELSRIKGLRTLEGIEAFSGLQVLLLFKLRQMEDYRAIAQLPALEHIAISDSAAIKTFDFLARLPSLSSGLVNGRSIAISRSPA